MDLNMFYGVLAGATATLLGLLFLAIETNMDRIFNAQGGMGKALALSTFQAYGQILVVCLFTFTVLLRAEVIEVAAALGIFRQIRNWLPLWRLSGQGVWRRVGETLWVFAVPTLLDAWLIYWATQLQRGRGSDGVETNIAVALVILLVILLRNSWRLLVEIPGESQAAAK